MLEIGLLNTALSDITLFHVFILLVFPYSIFYLFDRSLPNGFDKFSHWEGALFMFSVGSIIYVLAIWFSLLFKIPWFITYVIFLSLVTIYLKKLRDKIIKKRDFSNEEHMYRIKVPISIKLKNGNKYHGALRYIDDNKIAICITKECSIMLKKPDMKEAEKLENVHEMYFKITDIDYYYF